VVNIPKEHTVPNDKRLFRWLILLIFVPVLLAAFGGDRFRYACQNPENWGAAECQKPLCEINRQCPEHIFDNDSAILDIINGATTKGATSK